MRNIAGLGNAPCEAWTAVRHGQHKMDFEQWILGFLSGAGFAAHDKNPLHGRNPDAVWAWIDNYCTAHPLNRIADGGAAFVLDHSH